LLHIYTASDRIITEIYQNGQRRPEIRNQPAKEDDWAQYDGNKGKHLQCGLWQAFINQEQMRSEK
jgi:hypothetical protein